MLRVLLEGSEPAAVRGQYCLNYLRQMILCSPDLTLEPADALWRSHDVERSGGTHTCLDWRLVYEAMAQNWEEWVRVRDDDFDTVSIHALPWRESIRGLIKVTSSSKTGRRYASTAQLSCRPLQEVSGERRREYLSRVKLSVCCRAVLGRSCLVNDQSVRFALSLVVTAQHREVTVISTSSWSCYV